MKAVGTEEREETPFNMAMLYYIELHKLRTAKINARLQNDMMAYYDALDEISIQISFKLSEKDNNEIKKIMDDVEKDLNLNYTQNVQNMVYSNCKKKLRKVDRMIIKFMAKHHMIFPKGELRGLSAINERYGLEVKK